MCKRTLYNCLVFLQVARCRTSDRRIWQPQHVRDYLGLMEELCFPSPLFRSFLINIWEMNLAKNFLSKPSHFQSRQFGWCDLWMGHAICTGMTQVAGTWLAGDVAPRRRQSRQLVQPDWVMPTALARLTAQSPCATCPPVAPEQSVRLSHAELVGMTGGKLEPTHASSSSLSSLSRSGDRRWLLLHRRRSDSSDRCSWATPVLILPEGCYPLLTK
jgi:hypothetical protein